MKNWKQAPCSARTRIFCLLCGPHRGIVWIRAHTLEQRHGLVAAWRGAAHSVAWQLPREIVFSAQRVTVRPARGEGVSWKVSWGGRLPAVAPAVTPAPTPNPTPTWNPCSLRRRAALPATPHVSSRSSDSSVRPCSARSGSSSFSAPPATVETRGLAHFNRARSPRETLV